MNEWHRTTMAQDHCNDMLRYALKEQMLKEALRQGNEHTGFTCRALCRLGRGLAALGARLQEIYGSRADSPAFRTARPGPV